MVETLSMWHLFLAKPGDIARLTTDRLFHALEHVGIDAISRDAQKRIIRALRVLNQTTSHGLAHAPFYDSYKQIRDQISQGADLPNLKSILALGDATKANYSYYKQLETTDFWSAQFQAVRSNRDAYRQISA